MCALYARAQRIATTDDDGAIGRCEAGIAQKNTSVHNMRCKCEVHRSAGIRKKTMKLFKAHISFLIHVSLSIGMGSAMVIMRQEFRDILKSSFEFRRGAPPPHYGSELQDLLDVFWHQNVRVVQLRRVIVEALFTGSIAEEQVVHYCCGCCSGPEDSLRKFLALRASPPAHPGTTPRR
eukprot:9499840-Pyramimonas_sp.AAC.2